MATQLEKVVVNAQAGLPQHRAPEAGHNLLKSVARSPAFRHAGLPVRLRQGLAVHLSVRGQGQRREEDPGGRHHVIRQTRLERAAQFGYVGGRCAGGLGRLMRHHVGHQLPLGAFAASQDDRFPDSRKRRQRRFDLPQLDPETTES